MLCSGKIYYDIDGHERREQAESVAIARVELLYPFARDQLARADRAATRTSKEIVWVQEEPKNMGAWSVMCAPPARARCPRASSSATSAARSARAPSEGYPAAHRTEQERIVLTALDG